MASEILVKVGGQFRFCDAGTFLPVDNGTNWTIGVPTDVELALASLPAAGARQSDKVDLGATRAARYELLGCVDFTDETPTTGKTIDYFWAPSTSAVAANGNVAGNSGNAGVCPDGALGAITLDEFLTMCKRIGSLVIHDGGVVQNGWVEEFDPSSRYGQLIVVNNSGDAFESDNIEAHQVMNPIVDEAQ